LSAKKPIQGICFQGLSYILTEFGPQEGDLCCNTAPSKNPIFANNS